VTTTTNIEPPTFIKDPDATLDYRADWTANLAAGDTIATSTWIVPDGITKTSDASDATTATAWLSGGTEGATYEVTNRIVTAQGRTDDRSLRIRIANR
jgi:hypothetical protein